MSRLLELHEQLQEASAAIAQFEQAFAIEPNSKSVNAMLKSFQKRKASLEEEFLTLAKAVRADLCRYRFFSDSAEPLASAIGAGLVGFQRMFSLAYDAIKSRKPKKRARLTPEIVAESSFIFGHTFSGSVGVVLTFDNSTRTLFGSDLDESMAAIEALAKARSKAEVIASGKVLGVPCVNAMYQWASQHLNCGLGADIAWEQGHETKFRVVLQLDDLRQIVEAIGQTEALFDEEFEIDAHLAGADMSRRTFHIKLDEGKDLTGAIDLMIPDDHVFEINRRHRCALRKRVKVFYSTEQEEDVSHQLLSAIPIEKAQDAIQGTDA